MGPFADNAELLSGSYSASPDRQFTTTPWDVLQTLSSHAAYAAGCNDPLCSHYNSTAIADVVVRATFVIVCLGLGV